MRPVLRFIQNRILHVDDSPERSARGIAIGLFVGFLPLLGIQMVIAFFVAKILKANKVLAMLSAWISNPLTAVFIYYPCYRVGSFLLSHSGKPQYSSQQLEHIIENTFSADNIFGEFFTANFWKEVYSVSMAIGLEMLIGGIILGFIAGKIGYWISLKAIERYRRRRHHFLKRLIHRKASKSRHIGAA